MGKAGEGLVIEADSTAARARAGTRARMVAATRTKAGMPPRARMMAGAEAEIERGARTAETETKSETKAKRCVRRGEERGATE